MLDATKVSVINALSEMIADLAPHAYLRPMYGGLVIELEKENPRSRIGGFFTYSEHISLEFSKGIYLADPNGVLEGSGKFRRHVKLYAVVDINNKACKSLLNQAIARKELR